MDKDQVNEVLEKTFGENSVESFTVIPACASNENFTTTVLSFTVELKDQKDPLNLICKIYPHHPARQGLLNLTKIFQKEIVIYQHVFPQFINFQEKILRLNPSDIIHLPIPRFYSGFCSLDIKDSRQNFILLDDLSHQDFHIKNRSDPFDYSTCLHVISQLAKFHGLSYAYSLHSEQRLTSTFPQLVESILTEGNEGFMKEMITSNVTHCIKIVEKHHGLNSPEYQIAAKLGTNPDWVISHYLTSLNLPMSFTYMTNTKPQLFAKNRKKDNNGKYDPKDEENGIDNKNEEWLVLNHGDCWMGNFLFRCVNNVEEVTLVDFQMMREVSVTFDLVFLLIINGDKEFRDKYTEDVLKEYFEAFNGICKRLNVDPWKDFSLEKLKEKYEQTLLWGFVVAFFVLPIIWATPNKGDLDGIKEDVESQNVYQEMIKMNGKENKALEFKVLQIVEELIKYEKILFM